MIYQFGNYSLDTDGLELKRAGNIVALEPQVFRLLVYLIENRDRVVTKTELHEAIWKDRIVSDGALTTSVNLARNAVGDDGKTQTVVKTFPRRGFRFIADVAEVSGVMGPPGSGLSPQADLPSIAVLPFDDMSSERDQAYFADGMAEDIITALSRFHWFYVAARHSSFIYKDRNVDVRRIGEELGVRYVLEGSVRKGGDRLRISAQLVDTGTGNHLWADSFDGNLTDVFDLQDQITEGVVGAVEPSVQKAEIERARRKRPGSLDAYDLYLQALPHAWVTTKEEMETALDLLDEALRIDPDYPSAHGIATVCCLHLFMRG
ncbi:MAG: winged helix-turn-helix domain-containing protein, partial [Acidiferrobacterales bacterium]|nr:winged helix-turn-helix domain-containing protein [Acidiferrobacterales bacterium]